MNTAQLWRDWTVALRKVLGSAGFLPLAGSFGPGIVLCVAISVVSLALAAVEERLFGRAWIEDLVLAILLGTAIRSCWEPGPRWRKGISFSERTLLEIAVVLLGASLSSSVIAVAGYQLLGGVAAVVLASLIISFAIGRALGLPKKMAILIACGNSICGNSAIAAAAPVIEADSRDVATSIAFTAVLGVLVVVSLPLTISMLSLDDRNFGILAGMTVYAVPQVIAATSPAGAIALQTGTLIKLVRVLCLGPLIVILSCLKPFLGDTGPAALAPGGRTAERRFPPVKQLVPWFIVAFMLMMAMRSAGLVPDHFVPLLAKASGMLTLLAMAALGLGVNMRTVLSAGPRTSLTVLLSLGALALLSYGLITRLN